MLFDFQHDHYVCILDSHNLDPASNVSADAYDALDPNGNITITWDVMSWNADGYLVSIYIAYNAWITDFN